MYILPIDPSLRGTLLEGNIAFEGLNLTLGQRVTATVLEINSQGELLLDLGQQRLWARSQIPMSEGQEIELKVKQNGLQIQLQLLVGSQEQTTNEALLAVLRAEDGSGTAAEVDPARLLSALESILDKSPEVLSRPQSQQLESLLTPVMIEPNAERVARQLKNFLENSGVFFEAKLRSLLESLQAYPQDILRRLSHDLKMILANLQNQMAAVHVETGQFSDSNEALSSDPSHRQGIAETSFDGAHVSLRTQDSQETLAVLSVNREDAKLLKAIIASLEGSVDPAVRELSTRLLPLLRQIQNLGAEGISADHGFTTEVTSYHDSSGLTRGIDGSAKSPFGQIADSVEDKSSQSLNPSRDIQKLKPMLQEALRTLSASMASDPENEHLGQLNTLLTRVSSPSGSGSMPPGDPSAVGLAEQIQNLSSKLLSLQADAAFEWMTRGGMDANLPIQFGSQTTHARIRFFHESDRTSARGNPNRPLNINIFVDLPGSGKLEAWARWNAGHIQATLYVRDTAVREAFEPQLAMLSQALHELGFSNTQLEVKVDPVRLYRSSAQREEEIFPEGSLISLRV